MTITQQIAKQLRQVYFGGNWTSVNFKQTLSDLDWKQATTQVKSFNTIAALVFHTNYYVDAVMKVLRGEPLKAHDKLSFDQPPIQSREEWANILNKAFTDAENLACLIEQLPEAKLWDVFSEEKYGNYYRNIHGVIEHCHYHLGQMALIKKMLSTIAEESV